MKQGAAHVIFDNWKSERIVVDVLQGATKLAKESETHAGFAVFVPPRGFSDVGLRLRANEGASLH